MQKIGWLNISENHYLCINQQKENAQNSLAMMNYAYDTSLQETMILTEAFHTDRVICDNGSLYKFIWVQEGKLTLIVDHVEIEMEQDEIISVSNLHRTEFKNVSGRYLALLFNENFLRHLQA